MMLLRLTCFGLLVLMEMPTPNLAGHLSRQRLVYREIPVAEARRGMSKNIRARKAKQTDLHSTGNSSLMLQNLHKLSNLKENSVSHVDLWSRVILLNKYVPYWFEPKMIICM